MKHLGVARWILTTIVVAPHFAGSTKFALRETPQEHEDQPEHRWGEPIDGKSYWFYEAMGMLRNVRETEKGVEGTFRAGGGRTDFVVGRDQVSDTSARSEGYRLGIEKIIFFMSPTGSIPDNEANRKYVANLKERLKKITGMELKSYADWKKWLDANGDKLHWSPEKHLMVVEDQKKCAELRAVEIAKTDREVVKFCSGKVDGKNNGCDYKVRAADAAHQDGPEAEWVVTVSIIGGYDKDGKPVFMPEGAIFARVSKSCEVSSILGPNECISRTGNKACR